MLRYDRQTKPVALYDIRLENGAGPFLQPQSPHGAHAVDDDCDDQTKIRRQTTLT